MGKSAGRAIWLVAAIFLAWGIRTGAAPADAAEASGGEAYLMIDESAFVAIEGERVSRTGGGEVAIPAGRHELTIRRWDCASSQRIADVPGASKGCRTSPNQCQTEIDAEPGARFEIRTEGVDAVEREAWQAVVSPGTGCHPAEVSKVWFGREFFTCCNLFFNRDRDASDAGYLYAGNPATTMLPAGSRVKVVAVRGPAFTLETEAGDRYSLELRHGLRQVSRDAYFGAILLDHDRTAALKDALPPIREAVTAGKVVLGMTREQASMARGYPPRHQTPGWESEVWLYYDSPGYCRQVQFKSGFVDIIRPVDAP